MSYLTKQENSAIVLNKEVRCHKCHKKLGMSLEGRIDIVCPRCGHYNRLKN